jgi:uncharacterized protein YutE (UPF0331/DUF86 family)
MSFDIDRVLLRLNFIRDNLQQLNRFATINLDDYLNNLDIQLITERLLELIIQAAIDINKHIITQGLGLKFPEESRESFIKLWEANILTEDLAKKLSLSAGLRNILAHQYLEIDHTIVYASISKALIQYTRYIQQITAYLDSLE